MDYPPQYGKSPRGETGRGVAAILIMSLGVLIAAVITLVMLFSPAPTARSTPTFQDAEHSDNSVRQAAQLALDTYSSGSYGDFWDLWNAQAQAVIKREDYVRLFELCPLLNQETRFTIAAVTVTGDDARVQAARTGEAGDFAFVFEGGSWRYALPPQQQLEYRTKTVDQLVQEKRSAGACGTVTPAPPATSPAASPSAPNSTPAVTPPATSPPASNLTPAATSPPAPTPASLLG